jgi:hypothetical protein
MILLKIPLIGIIGWVVGPGTDLLENYTAKALLRYAGPTGAASLFSWFCPWTTKAYIQPGAPTRKKSRTKSMVPLSKTQASFTHRVVRAIFH